MKAIVKVRLIFKTVFIAPDGQTENIQHQTLDIEIPIDNNSANLFSSALDTKERELMKEVEISVKGHSYYSVQKDEWKSSMPTLVGCEYIEMINLEPSK